MASPNLIIMAATCNATFRFELVSISRSLSELSLQMDALALTDGDVSIDILANQRLIGVWTGCQVSSAQTQIAKSFNALIYSTIESRNIACQSSTRIRNHTTDKKPLTFSDNNNAIPYLAHPLRHLLHLSKLLLFARVFTQAYVIQWILIVRR